MRRLLLITALLFCVSAPAQTPSEAKPYLRWWWHGSAVDRRGLDYNLSEFAQKGFGGVEITPIYGVQGNEANDLRYLSPEWMEAYKHTVARARELGLQVDLSNTTGWPFGGAWITPEHSAQKYILECYDFGADGQLRHPLQPEEEKQRPVAHIEALQAVSPTGRRIDLMPHLTAQGTLAWRAPGTGWKLYALYAGRTLQKVKRAAPGGEGLVLNHYNRDAVEFYLAHFDRAFAAANAPYPDTFFNDSFEVYGANWDTTLLAEFEREHHYRLQDYLPEFAAQGSNELSARIICDYRTTLAGMLLRNFTLPWRDWAHRHGCRIRNQAHGSPGNIFDFYAAVDIPECESYGSTPFTIPYLRRDANAKPSDADPAVLKFASSASHVTGKRLTSCETLTWLTEHFHTSLAQCKPEIDQILASGVNHVYFHGAPYSPADAAFPGWLFYATINLSPTAPLWRDTEGMTRYVERCQQVLQAGEADNDFLLYIPMEDISYAQQGKNLLLFDIHKMERTMPALKRVMNDLVRGGYDADYISDRAIDSLTVTPTGDLRSEGGAHFRALILPTCRLLSVATLEKVLTLASNGATVVFLDRYPEDVPGFGTLNQRRTALKQLLEQLPATDFSATTAHRFGHGRLLTGSDLRGALHAAGGAFEPLKAQGCHLVRRTTDNGKSYFIALCDSTVLDGWVEISAPARTVLLTDPLTGRRGIAASRPTSHGTTELYLQLLPGQSILLHTLDTTPDIAPWRYLGIAGEAIAGRGWTLDFPASTPAVEASFALDTPSSWTSLAPELAANCGTGRYTATFSVPDPTAADTWLLDLGDVRESARVTVNGHDAGIAWSLPFTLDVSTWLRAGDNRIEIRVTNLPANLIADYDRRGIPWRIFKDANILSASGNALDTSTWGIAPSGLNSDVKLIPIKHKHIQ